MVVFCEIVGCMYSIIVSFGVIFDFCFSVFIVKGIFGVYATLLVSEVANFYGSSYVCMISAVICMLLRRVWHLCNFACVNALFRLVFITRFAFTSPSICFLRDKISVYREQFAYLHSISCRRARLQLELFTSTVRLVSYHGYHICPRAVFFRHAVALLGESYTLV